MLKKSYRLKIKLRPYRSTRALPLQAEPQSTRQGDQCEDGPRQQRAGAPSRPSPSGAPVAGWSRAAPRRRRGERTALGLPGPGGAGALPRVKHACSKPATCRANPVRHFFGFVLREAPKSRGSAGQGTAPIAAGRPGAGIPKARLSGYGERTPFSQRHLYGDVNSWRQKANRYKKHSQAVISGKAPVAPCCFLQLLLGSGRVHSQLCIHPCSLL